MVKFRPFGHARVINVALMSLITDIQLHGIIITTDGVGTDTYPLKRVYPRKQYPLKWTEIRIISLGSQWEQVSDIQLSG